MEAQPSVDPGQARSATAASSRSELASPEPRDESEAEQRECASDAVAQPTPVPSTSASPPGGGTGGEGVSTPLALELQEQDAPDVLGPAKGGMRRPLATTRLRDWGYDGDTDGGGAGGDDAITESPSAFSVVGGRLMHGQTHAPASGLEESVRVLVAGDHDGDAAVPYDGEAATQVRDALLAEGDASLETGGEEEEEDGGELGVLEESVVVATITVDEDLEVEVQVQRGDDLEVGGLHGCTLAPVRSLTALPPPAGNRGAVLQGAQPAAEPRTAARRVPGGGAGGAGAAGRGGERELRVTPGRGGSGAKCTVHWKDEPLVFR